MSQHEQEWWHERWQQNQIGFHLPDVHPWLKKYGAEVGIHQAERVFVPLCGKTHDIGFFLSLGMEVVANELNEMAIQSLFEQLDLDPVKSPWKAGTIYQAGSLTVYVGDFFELTHGDVGSVDWVYDRAAVIALPETMRSAYAKQLMAITDKAAQCLITLDYDQNEMDGPPFSVMAEEINNHYADDFKVAVIHERDILEDEPNFKQRGLSRLNQALYLLSCEL
ncbi:thiopurine S-methyltransferase [Bermanella marisrubri]|nr:thiopurine S-methyltransferase [Bermanella marisrubri]QIZ83553.1 thiopurine S-methyltransferase [Bermanella marisrubri]